jgi:hypothetical protein
MPDSTRMAAMTAASQRMRSAGQRSRMMEGVRWRSGDDAQHAALDRLQAEMMCAALQGPNRE